MKLAPATGLGGRTSTGHTTCGDALCQEMKLSDTPTPPSVTTSGIGRSVVSVAPASFLVQLVRSAELELMPLPLFARSRPASRWLSRPVICASAAPVVERR